MGVEYVRVVGYEAVVYAGTKYPDVLVHLFQDNEASEPSGPVPSIEQLLKPRVKAQPAATLRFMDAQVLAELDACVALEPQPPPDGRRTITLRLPLERLQAALDLLRSESVLTVAYDLEGNKAALLASAGRGAKWGGYIGVGI